MSSVNQSTELAVAYAIKFRDQESIPLTPLTLDIEVITKTTMASETSLEILKVSLVPFLLQLSSSSLVTAWARAYLIDRV